MGSSLSSLSFHDRHKAALTGAAGDVNNNRSKTATAVRWEPTRGGKDHMHISNPNSIQLNGKPFTGDGAEQLRALDGQEVVMNVTQIDPAGTYPAGKHVGGLQIFGSAEDSTHVLFAIGGGVSVYSDEIKATITPVPES